MEEEQGGETQTVYGDLITFLFGLFVLLFVLSYNETRNETFFVELQVKLRGEQKPLPETITEALVVSKLENYVKQEQLDQLVQIVVDEQKVKIILDPPVLFDSGYAILKPQGKKILEGFGRIIQEVKNPIVIEGHTDNIPIHNEFFDSNWDLSFHRAYSVVKFFVGLGFSPKQLSGLGYGEYQPRASNTTKEGRAKNRRIEINIIRLLETQGANVEKPAKMPEEPSPTESPTEPLGVVVK